MVIGASVTLLGSEKHMQIYAEYLMEILSLTKDKAGLIALISAPEVIVAEIIYMIGILCFTRKNLIPLNKLLNSTKYSSDEQNYSPKSLFEYKHIYYSDALGGYSTALNDHIRQFLKSLSWLLNIAPRLRNKIDEYQLQVNLLLVLFTVKSGDYLWPDFARWYAKRVMPFVNMIKYDDTFQKQISDMFNISKDELGSTFSKYLSVLQERGLDRYHWQSIYPDDFLIDVEKRQ